MENQRININFHKPHPTVLKMFDQDGVDGDEIISTEDEDYGSFEESEEGSYAESEDSNNTTENINKLKELLLINEKDDEEDKDSHGNGSDNYINTDDSDGDETITSDTLFDQDYQNNYYDISKSSNSPDRTSYRDPLHFTIYENDTPSRRYDSSNNNNSNNPSLQSRASYLNMNNNNNYNNTNKNIDNISKSPTKPLSPNYYVQHRRENWFAMTNSNNTNTINNNSQINNNNNNNGDSNHNNLNESSEFILKNVIQLYYNQKDNSQQHINNHRMNKNSNIGYTNEEQEEEKELPLQEEGGSPRSGTDSTSFNPFSNYSIMSLSLDGLVKVKKEEVKLGRQKTINRLKKKIQLKMV